MRTLPFVLLALMVATTTAACRSGNVKPSIPTAAPVDVDRFMGDWYVIAHIPSFPERDAYAAVESYAKLPDGRIRVTFDTPQRAITAGQAVVLYQDEVTLGGGTIE